MALLGPNCMGIINFFDGAAVWGSDNHMNKVEGYGAAFISQSGAFVFNSSNIEIGFPLGYAYPSGKPISMLLLLKTKAPLCEIKAAP